MIKPRYRSRGLESLEPRVMLSAADFAVPDKTPIPMFYADNHAAIFTSREPQNQHLTSAIILDVAPHARQLHEFAPASIAGMTIKASIKDGSGLFSSKGSYSLLIASSGDNYLLLGDGTHVAPSFGTFTYTKLGPNTAELTIDDSGIGSIDAIITFTKANKATYEFIGGGQSVEHGTFSLTLPNKIYAPFSMANRLGHAKITKGASPFAAHGKFDISLAASTYIIQGGPGVSSSTGTYTYEVYSPTSSIVIFDDNLLGSGALLLQFSSAKHARYALISLDLGGWQLGNLAV